MARLSALLVGLVACGCGDGIITFALPPLDGARAAVFAIQTGSRFEARAVDLDAGEVVVAFPVDLEPDAEGRLELLAFEERLADLGLSPGVINSVSDGVRLTPEDAHFSATFRGRETSDWTAGGTRSAAVDAIRLPVRTACTELAVEVSYTLDTSADHTFAIALSPEEVLLASEDGKVYLVDRSGARPVTDLPPNLPILDRVELGDGSILFGGDRGRVFRGRIGTSTTGSPVRISAEPLTAIPSEEPIIRMAGGDENGELELFVLGRMGGFYRFGGGSWEKLHDFRVNVSTASGVARPRPGLAYAGSDERAEVMRYRDGAVELVSPPDLVNGVPGLAYLPEIGLLMSRTEGGIYLLPDGGDWTLLGESPISLNVYAFYWLGNSFLFGGTFGFVSEYRVGIDYCPVVQLGAGAIRTITPFGDGFIFGEDKPQSRNLVQATIVRRAR